MAKNVYHSALLFLIAGDYMLDLTEFLSRTIYCNFEDGS